MKRYRPCWKGWQLLSLTSIPFVAARTWASTQGLETTRARLARFRSFHAGLTERKRPGRSSSSGWYHPTPKPSPLRGSARSSDR
jgi:hypothetical protein